jgi:hypothetical protein
MSTLGKSTGEIAMYSCGDPFVEEHRGRMAPCTHRQWHHACERDTSDAILCTEFKACLLLCDSRRFTVVLILESNACLGKLVDAWLLSWVAAPLRGRLRCYSRKRLRRWVAYSREHEAG